MRSRVVEAPLDILPLFARASSILLLGPESLHTYEENPVEIRIYSGQDAEFIWYREKVHKLLPCLQKAAGLT